MKFDISAIRNYADLYETSGLAQYLSNTPNQGGMTDAQKLVHSDPHERRIVIAGNQVGKTRILAAEAWWLAIGSHPFREAEPAPNIGWIMCADLRGGWANFSSKMHEIEPPGILDPSCHFDSARGYLYKSNRMIVLSSGSIIIGKSGTQEMMALAGATIDWLLIDELPKQGHFSEARSRVAVKGGPVAMAFTPIGRPADWLRRHIEGDPDTDEPPVENWSVQRIKLTPENCPHRDPDNIAKQIAAYGPWEYAQRVEGAWSGITMDRWISFSEQNVFTSAPNHVEQIGLGWDHGEKPGNSVCYLVVFDGSKLWVLDEYVSKERNTPATEAIEIQKMLQGWGIRLNQIDVARGDSNSAGRLGLGLKVNELLERSFAHLSDSSRPPFQIMVPYKGRGSVKTRARMLSSACVDGRFMVHEGCPKLINTLRHWHGQNDDLKHCYDAISYIAEPFLMEDMSGAGHMIIG